MSDYGFHPVVLASDTTDLQANSLVRISEAITKGVPAAAASGLLSIWNTGADYLGADQVDIEQAIRRYDNEMGDYYAENKEAIDIVGMIGTSLIPGSIGIKALQLARSGTALGNVSRALNLTASRKNHYLQQALKETAEAGGVIPSIFTANRARLAAWEVADQALLGSAFELGVIAAMHDSPAFDNYSFSDFAFNAALGAGVGGLLGGTLSSIAAKGVLKQAAGEIQSQMRLVDTVFDPERMGLTKGTEALILAEQIANLPESFKNIQFTPRGSKTPVELDISGALSRARRDAAKSGTDKLAMKFNELAEGNAVVGQAVFDWMQRAAVAAKEAGKSPSEVTHLLHGYLNQLERISTIDLDRMALDARKFYVRKTPMEGSAAEKLAGMFSSKRTKQTGAQPYYLADGVTAADLNIGRLEDLGETNVRTALRNNPELDVIQRADGTVHINPYSTKVKKLKESPVKHSMYLNLEFGDLLDEVAVAFGDTVAHTAAKFTDDAVWAGKRKYAQPSQKAISIGDSPLDISARYAWASQLTPAQFKRIVQGSIDLDDLPMLDRLIEMVESNQLSLEQARQISLVGKDTTTTLADIIDLKQFAAQRRIELLTEQLNNWKAADGSVPSSEVIAIQLNVSREWVESIIANGFTAPKGTDFAAVLRPTSAAMAPRNVQLTWDFGVVSKMLPEEAYKMNMGPNHLVTQELTKEYQLAIRQRVADNAFDAALGEDAALFLDSRNLINPDEESLARFASNEGAGASLFGASNAGYGERAKLWVQDTGKNVALVTQRRRDAVVETLAPSINALRESPEAAAELGILTNALRKSRYRYVFDDTNPNRIVSIEAKRLAQAEDIEIDEAIAFLERQPVDGVKSPHSFTIEDQRVIDFLQTSTRINNVRQEKLTTLYNATGLVKNDSALGAIYVPPINTVKYPYHAFVRTKQKVGLAHDISMITAKSEQQLRELAAKVGDDYDVIYKADTDAYYKIKGEYDYSLTLNEARVNSDLSRRGVLADFAPETRFENIMEDYLQWHAKSEEKLVRTAVQVKNRQFFSEMQFLSDQYRKVSESVTRGIGSRFKSKVADPFGDHIKTALNISKQQEFPLLDSLNDFVDKVSLSAGDALERASREAKQGLISYEEANKIAERYGLGMPYRDIDQYLTLNERLPRNLVREGFQKANMALATTMLRLDFANSLINMISTPIMIGTEMSSIKQLIKNDSALAGKLNELMSVQVPGQSARMPSTTKLIGNAINNFFGKDKQALLQRYRDIGSVKEVSRLYHDMLDDLSFRPDISPKEFMKKINNGVEIGAKISGNTFAEDFTRFVSADVMRQLSDPLVAAGRMTRQEQNAYISTFVNRVQGNYVTSQRPVVFQGTTGAAVSLFQTYAFNVLQQLHRHIQAGDKKTLLTFAGLQSTVFGFNGLPFFDAINQHIIGSWMANNAEHQDAYSVLPAFNKELGDWLLYGTASAFPLFSGQAPALYTRGDINPRHITVLPMPWNLQDIPVIGASIKLYDAVAGMGKQVIKGADVSDALLHGLEHQGWNRPLAGFAQLLAGRTTTSKGALVSAASEMQTTSWLGALAERTISLEGATRLMGARPMDEAVALNALYRQKKYDVLDRARIEALGQAVKTKLYGGEVPTDEELMDFMERYARSGGRIENFSRAMQTWSRDANVSIVNQLAGKLGTPRAQKLQTIMGGEMLPDYLNQAVEEGQ